MKTLCSTLITGLFLCLPLSLAAVTIEGQVPNFPFPEIMFNLLFGRFHLFMDDEIILPDEAGNFRYELEVDEIRFAQVKFKEKTIQLFLDPAAEKIILELDYTADDLALRFSGDTAAENAFINQRLYPIYHDKLRTLLPEQSSSPDAVDHFAAVEEAVELDILNEIRDQISEANYQLLRQEISAYYLTLRIQAGNNIGWRNREEYKAHWMMRNEALGKLIDCQTTNKFAPYFNHLIHTYYDHLRIKYYYLQSPGDSTVWQERFGVDSKASLADLTRNDKYNLELYVVGKAGFCEAIFEKLLSNRIFRSEREGDYENLIRIYEAFADQFPESKYLPVLKAGMGRIYDLEKIYKNKISGIHFYPEKALKEGILAVVEQERYRERVLFLDIWGTWCGPCRDEFPHMQKIKDELKDAGITYLYFADEKTKEPEAHWMKTVKFYGLKGDHYLVKKELIFQFLKDIDQYKPMFSYPTYMIVNRRGEIVNPDAPDPSDKEALLAALRKALADE